MATKIRLARHGRKKMPIYSIVIADERSPRDGKFIEKLGTFNPHLEPVKIELHEERALHWVMKGAQPTDTVRTLLSQAGVMMRKHLQVGVNKGAISQETADSRFESWKADKEKKDGHALFISKDNPVEPEVKEEIVVEAPKKVAEVAKEATEVAEGVVEKVKEATEVAKEAVVEKTVEVLDSVKETIAKAVKAAKGDEEVAKEEDAPKEEEKKTEE